MCGAIPPFPQYVFMAWCLVKHRDNFTFTIPLLMPLRIFKIFIRLTLKVMWLTLLSHYPIRVPVGALIVIFGSHYRRMLVCYVEISHKYLIHIPAHTLVLSYFNLRKLYY
jgi:hypothetical protein